MKIFVKAKLIITDSGGIQEEASFLNKKVIVCRKSTERPEGIRSGHLHICSNSKKLMNLFIRLNKNFKINKKSPYGDGRASKKLLNFYSSKNFIMITVVLNIYKRLEYLEEQIKAINNQSVKVSEIIIWQNGTEERKIPNLDPSIKHIYSTHNFGVWSRFSAALNSKNEFICIFDDDTIPGKNWIKNCLNTIQKYEGLLGSRGVRFASKKIYSW